MKNQIIFQELSEQLSNLIGFRDVGDQEIRPTDLCKPAASSAPKACRVTIGCLGCLLETVWHCLEVGVFSSGVPVTQVQAAHS